MFFGGYNFGKYFDLGISKYQKVNNCRSITLFLSVLTKLATVKEFKNGQKFEQFFEQS